MQRHQIKKSLRARQIQPLREAFVVASLVLASTYVGSFIVKYQPTLDRVLQALHHAAHTSILYCLPIAVLAGYFVFQKRKRSVQIELEAERAGILDRLLAETMGEVVYDYNPADQTTRWRGDLERLIGYHPSEIPSIVNYRNLLQDEDRTLLPPSVEAGVYDLRYRARRKDGQVIWLHDRGRKATQQDGVEELFVGALRDITSEQGVAEQMRTLFEKSNIPQLLIRGSIILNANPAATALFGLHSVDELPGLDFAATYLQHAAAAVDAWQTAVDASRHEDCVRCHLEISRTDGSLLPVEATLSQVTLGGEKVVLASLLDLSEIASTQESLRKSEQRFRDVSEAAGEYIWETDAQNRFSYLSSRVQEVMGHSVSEMLNRDFFHFVPLHFIGSVRQSLTAIFDRREVFRNFEFPVQRAGGSLIWLSLSGVPVLDANGEFLGFRGAGLDITDRKISEQALEQSEERYRSLVEDLQQVVLQMDLDGRLTFLNSAWVRTTGHSLQDAMGQELVGFVVEEDRPLWLNTQTSLSNRSTETSRLDIRLRARDGSIRWVECFLRSVVGPNAGVISIVGTLTDATKRREYEEELLRTRENAVEADRAKSEFLAIMSHEIRTPLNSVLGYADLLANTPLSTNQKDYLETIRSSGGALLELLSDLLDLSRIESGRIELDPQPVDVTDCVEEVLRIKAPAAAEKQIALVQEVSPLTPRWILTDHTRLRQILLNLVGNSIKFTSQGRVLLRVEPIFDDRQHCRAVHFFVRDTGIGIPSDKIEKIFLPFAQADSSTTRKYGGTGLGLAISRRLAELLGGDLGVVETSESGTTFALTIPAQDVPREGVEATPISGRSSDSLSIPAVETASRKVKILIVEDNPINAKLMLRMLQLMGQPADVAPDGAVAVAMTHEQQYDLIFMDIQMPGMDGYEATKFIRAREEASGERPVQIVALTADAFQSTREKCLNVGMNGYISKPVQKDLILEAIHRAAAAAL